MEYVRKRKRKKLKKLVQFNMAGFEVLKNMEYLRKRKKGNSIWGFENMKPT